MEASGIGVNSPEFVQKKIERLKTALDEANALMDRHVTERDEARAQLDSARRENDELRRQLEAGGGGGEAAPAEPGLDPALEQELRDRIAALEGERDTLQGEHDTLQGERDTLEGERETLQAASGGDRELLARVAALQNELEEARRQADQARG